MIERRDAGRHKQVFHLWSHLHDDLHQRMPRVGFWLDNSELTESETVQAVIANLEEAVIE